MGEMKRDKWEDTCAVFYLKVSSLSALCVRNKDISGKSARIKAWRFMLNLYIVYYLLIGIMGQ